MPRHLRACGADEATGDHNFKTNMAGARVAEGAEHATRCLTF